MTYVIFFMTRPSTKLFQISILSQFLAYILHVLFRGKENVGSKFGNQFKDVTSNGLAVVTHFLCDLRYCDLRYEIAHFKF